MTARRLWRFVGRQVLFSGWRVWRRTGASPLLSRVADPEGRPLHDFGAGGYSFNFLSDAISKRVIAGGFGMEMGNAED